MNCCRPKVMNICRDKMPRRAPVSAYRWRYMRDTPATRGPGTINKCDKPRSNPMAWDRANLYNNSCWPRRSALNSAYSLRYLAFRLPSLMHSQALRGPLAMSQCIIDGSVTYLGRRVGALTTV